MKNVAFCSIDQLQTMLLKEEISHEELLQFFIDRFKKYDEKLGSSLEIFEKKTILKNLKQGGILNGIPGLIKDNICQESRTVSCASKMLEHYKAPYDATAIKRLKEAGALLIGRANMDEFAMGSSTETSAFKKTCNPWDFSRVPGGSSGGSIAAVAAGLVPWALGSETGGSVRQPAAFCGIVGFKPTYGLISRYGLIAYASSLDQIGIATRFVKDNAHVLQVVSGLDPYDATTACVSNKSYIEALTGSIRPGLRIGIIENACNAEGIDGEVVSAINTAVKQLQKLGAQVKAIRLPSLDYSAAVYFIISRAQAASNLARFDGVRYGLRDQNASTLQAMYANTRHDGFGKEVRARIIMGNYVLSAGHANAFYANAKKVQSLMQYEMSQAFNEVDILIAPTHPAPAFKFGAFAENKLHMDLQDYFTCPMNITGMPAISIPCGFSSQAMPIGFQLIGNYFSEELLYQTAYAYEQSTEWHMKHPEYFLA